MIDTGHIFGKNASNGLLSVFPSGDQLTKSSARDQMKIINYTENYR